MLRLLPFVLGLALSIYCLIDCVRSEDEAVRGLPKLVWVFVILLFPFAGGVGWLVAGRPTVGPLPGRSGLPGFPGRTQPRQAPPRGPDDDPDFLKGL